MRTAEVVKCTVTLIAVSLIRKHGQFIGYVEAPDRKAAP
jgi:hypothetical protein